MRNPRHTLASATARHKLARVLHARTLRLRGWRHGCVRVRSMCVHVGDVRVMGVVRVQPMRHGQGVGRLVRHIKGGQQAGVQHQGMGAELVLLRQRRVVRSMDGGGRGHGQGHAAKGGMRVWRRRWFHISSCKQ